MNKTITFPGSAGAAFNDDRFFYYPGAQIDYQAVAACQYDWTVRQGWDCQALFSEVTEEGVEMLSEIVKQRIPPQYCRQLAALILQELVTLTREEAAQ